tara:strand:+ start:3018 stop:4856 length:1839 start_codon:yes stop_codon:yes gene_type:complete
MIINSETVELLGRLLRALPRPRRRSLYSLIPVAALAGISDVLVVGLVSRVFTIVVGQPNRPSLPFGDLIPDDPKWKVIWLVVLYIGMNWIASFLKLFLRAYQERLRASIWLDLSELAQKNILAQPYEFFISKDNSNLANRVLLNISRVSEYLVKPLLEITSGLFIILFISIAVLLIAKSVALYLIISLLICYALISFIVTPFIRFAGRQRIRLEKETNNVLSESMRTIIDLHLTGSERYFERKYSSAGGKAFPFIWKAEVLPEFPRALIEPLGITLIFSIGLFPILSNNQPYNLTSIVPFVATIAVASLKLTPPLQDSFRALTRIRAGVPDLKETLKLIELSTKRLTINSNEIPSPKGIEPRNYIKLDRITYKYPNSEKNVLENINITIPVGARTAFVGKTGSGKTTTANQLLGLLRPTSGSLQLDGLEVSESEIPAWQACCSYVPQAINLLNSTIIENVAYGLNDKEIDDERVWDAIEAAQLENVVSDLPMGLYTNIGENGIRLSGGQRQRLAIAKAFYRKCSFLILDEATSSLDNKTEADVMDSIDLIGRGCTIVIIAHRLSTVKRCDYIYEFENGKIKGSGNYQQLSLSSQSFHEMISAAENNPIDNII